MSKGQPIRNKSKIKASILSASNFLLPTDFTRYLKLDDPQEDQIIKYNGTNWINSAQEAVPTTLGDLTDVNVTDPPADFDFLTFAADGESGEWYPSNPFGVPKFYNSPSVNNTGIVSSNVSPGVYNLTWPRSVYNNGYTIHLTVEMRDIFETPTIVTTGFRVLNSSTFQIYTINDAQFENNYFTFSVMKFGKLAAHGTVADDGTLLSLTYNDGVL